MFCLCLSTRRHLGFTGVSSRVDYGIRQVSVCPRTPLRRVQLRPFHYDDSLMYAAVGDINYIVESVVSGKGKHLDGEGWA